MKPQTLITEDGRRITVIHFCQQVSVDDLQQMRVVNEERVACLPNARDLSANERGAPVMRSDDPRVVNCPLCKSTPAYKFAMEEIQRAPRHRNSRPA